MQRTNSLTTQVRVLHVDDDPEFAGLSAELLERSDPRIQVETESSPKTAHQRIKYEGFDCVVSDYDMPELNGIELLKKIRTDRPELPFILLTGQGSEEVASKAISAGLTDYIKKRGDSGQFEILSQKIINAVESNLAVRQLNSKDKELEKSQNLIETFRQLNDCLVRSSSRSEIEAGVCETMVESGEYTFAWIGTLDTDDEVVHPTTARGTGVDYVDDLVIRKDDSPTGQGPGGTALRTGDVSVSQNIRKDPEFEPWRDEAIERGYSSVAAVPIVYEDSVFGLLGVYADRTNAFDEDELALFEDFSEAIGHALHRVELNNKLRDPKSRYHNLLAEAPDAIVVANADGKIIEANESAGELFECSPTKLVGKDQTDLHPPTDRDKYKSLFESHMRHEGSISRFDDGSQVYIKTAEDRIVPVEINAATFEIFNEAYVYGSFRDISERLDRKHRIRAFAEAFPDLAFLFDANARYVDILSGPESQELLLGDDLLGKSVSDVLPDHVSSIVEESLEKTIQTNESQRFEYRLTVEDDVRWFQARTAPFQRVDGDSSMVVMVSREISEEKRRERLFGELQSTSEELIQAQTEQQIADYLVSAATEVLELRKAAVYLFNDEHGSLRVTSNSEDVNQLGQSLPEIEPGENRLWDVYRKSEAVVLEELPRILDGVPWEPQIIAVPLGGFGVLLGSLPHSEEANEICIDAVEILATNAKAALERLSEEQNVTEISRELTEEQSRAEELTRLTDSINRIQGAVAESETQDELEESVCNELAQTESVDFVWIGRPMAQVDNLSAETWAGEGGNYLDSVSTESDTDNYLPAKVAARKENIVTVSSIPERVHEEEWRKEALSHGFRSAMSVPLIFNDVLYAVLTAYSQEDQAFEGIVGNLISDLGPLLASSMNIRGQHYEPKSNRFFEMEFEISDTSCRFYQLAYNTQCTLRFDSTAPSSSSTTTSVLCTVEQGEIDRVIEEAEGMATIYSADFFGEEEGRQLILELEEPALISQAHEHGGHIQELVADHTSTRVVIEMSTEHSARPLLDYLTTNFSEIDLVARREQVTDSASASSSSEELTERQYEILKAAYYGGYYESPKQITGTGIADNFDISSPVVYNHLQTAERKIIGRYFDSYPETDGLDK